MTKITAGKWIPLSQVKMNFVMKSKIAEKTERKIIQIFHGNSLNSLRPYFKPKTPWVDVRVCFACVFRFPFLLKNFFFSS